MSEPDFKFLSSKRRILLKCNYNPERESIWILLGSVVDGSKLKHNFRTGLHNACRVSVNPVLALCLAQLEYQNLLIAKVSFYCLTQKGMQSCSRIVHGLNINLNVGRMI